MKDTSSLANSIRVGQVVKTAGDAGEGSSSQLFLTLASLLLPMDSGSPLPTLDLLSLTPPHSLGEVQWDEAGELRRVIRCGQALVAAEMTWVSPCVPPGITHLFLEPPSQAREAHYLQHRWRARAGSWRGTTGIFFWNGSARVCSVSWWKEQGTWRHVRDWLKSQVKNFGLAPYGTSCESFGRSLKLSEL